MKFPPEKIWERPLDVSYPPLVLEDGTVVARSAGTLVGLDPSDGADRWRIRALPEDTSGSFLRAYGSLILTDHRPDPEHLTEVVGARDGKVVLRTPLRTIVPKDTTAVVAGHLYVTGHDPTRGDVLNAIDLATGQVKIERPTPRDVDALLVLGDRLLMLDRQGSPGLYSLAPDGTDDRAIEPRRAHSMKLSGGRLLATLADDAGDTRWVQARDAATMTELWTAPASGPACGLDGDVAVHGEEHDGKWVPVARDAATGVLRWRGAPLRRPAAWIYFAGPWVLVVGSLVMTAYDRQDGRMLGSLELAIVSTVHGDRVYIGGPESLFCARLP